MHATTARSAPRWNRAPDGRRAWPRAWRWPSALAIAAAPTSAPGATVGPPRRPDRPPRRSRDLSTTSTTTVTPPPPRQPARPTRTARTARRSTRVPSLPRRARSSNGAGSSFAAPAIETFTTTVAASALQPRRQLLQHQLGRRPLRVHQPDDRLRRQRHRLRTGQHRHHPAELPVHLRADHRRWHRLHVQHPRPDQDPPAHQLHGLRHPDRRHHQLGRLGTSPPTTPG